MLRFASSKRVTGSHGSEGVDGAKVMPEVKSMATGKAAAGSSGSARGQFDAFRLAARGEALAGEVDMARRARVRDRLAQAAGTAMVSWLIEGGRDALGRPALTVTVQGDVPLECQRCLQAFDTAIEQRSELLLARDEGELAKLDAEEREVLLASVPLDAMTLIEDELLLSLPFAPMHPEAQCPAPAQAVDSGGEPERNTPSPFARLAALKKRSGGTSKE
jgi:uncharacterized protein